MANVPWHKDVREFSLALADAAGGGEYELAAEHVHSCCCLLARPKLFKDSEGRWRTWINYERFHDLVSFFKGFANSCHMDDIVCCWNCRVLSSS